ncbi:MAG: cardiolipin synthase [Nitrospirae bacterium]|nr:cardiolipin synthase [Nitrospirota bacterium]
MERILSEHILPQIAGLLTLVVTVASTVHVILTKKNARSAFSWIGIIWLVPLLGPLLYILFGINRIKRKAKLLRSGISGIYESIELPEEPPLRRNPPFDDHLITLSKLIGRVINTPPLPGNQIIPLEGGDAAYTEMLKLIEASEDTINLSTYIFDNDRAGNLFIDALASAHKRGVDIRIIVDDMGARYSFPPVTKKLKKIGIRTVRFLPTLIPTRMPFVNLRNHRKILVIDGKIGFTGGMNIREGHMLSLNPKRPVKDIHFLVKGPVVRHMQQVFAEDWYFCTGELLDGERWFPPIHPEGQVWARGIPDGPDEDFEKHLITVQGALTVAKKSIKIVTPYFLPESELISIINIASLRGIQVDIVLPGLNNIPIIKWASFNILEQIINENCRIYLSPPPFDHSKIMVVDDSWSLIGSANWDARSFRLNFEFNIECYDYKLAERLSMIIDSKIKDATPLTPEILNKRPFPIKIRDGLAFMFSPYL